MQMEQNVSNVHLNALHVQIIVLANLVMEIELSKIVLVFVARSSFQFKILNYVKTVSTHAIHVKVH